MFWVDLSAAGLISGGFNTASATVIPSADITTANMGLYLPHAQLGGGNYIYVYSGFYYDGVTVSNTGVNYFGLSSASAITANSGQGLLNSTAKLSVVTAYNIDKKIDDGLPQSGRVMAWYLNGSQVWTDGSSASYTPGEPVPNLGAITGSATTCYDNNGTAGVQQYSMGKNNGAGLNCALSFRFQ
jgi:hypothetical protein